MQSIVSLIVQIKVQKPTVVVVTNQILDHTYSKSSIISIDRSITDNIRKSVGSGMEPCGTPALTGYSCEDFPSRTTQRRLLLRKGETMPNTWPRSWRRTECLILSKDLDVSSTAARVTPDLLKALIFLPNTTVRRSAVDQEDLTPC